MRVTIGKTTKIIIKGEEGKPDIEVNPGWMQEYSKGKGKNREHVITFYPSKIKNEKNKP